MARIISSCLLALVLALPAAAQTSGQQQAPPPPTPPPAAAPVQAAPPAKPDEGAYEVGPDDTISIVVYGEAELPKEFKVGADGLINFPFIGDLRVAGLSVRGIESEIRKQLVAGKYLSNPQVVVTVTAYRSQTVQVQGQVNSPGDLTLQGTEMTLSRALSKAQMTALAGSYIEIRRRKSGMAPDAAGADAFLVIRVERADLDSLNMDPRLLDGDQVFVPKAPQFFLNGYVKQTGPQVWTPGLTVGKAIAAAGGISDRGTLSGLKIRRLVNGKYKDFKVDINSIVLEEDQIMVRQRRF